MADKKYCEVCEQEVTPIIKYSEMFFTKIRDEICPKCNVSFFLSRQNSLSDEEHEILIQSLRKKKAK